MKLFFLLYALKPLHTIDLFFLRADYWKSNDRKYCDFCKCWITDNKPVSEALK